MAGTSIGKTIPFTSVKDQVDSPVCASLRIDREVATDTANPTKERYRLIARADIYCMVSEVQLVDALVPTTGGFTRFFASFKGSDEVSLKLDSGWNNSASWDVVSESLATNHGDGARQALNSATLTAATDWDITQEEYVPTLDNPSLGGYIQYLEECTTRSTPVIQAVELSRETLTKNDSGRTSASIEQEQYRYVARMIMYCYIQNVTGLAEIVSTPQFIAIPPYASFGGGTEQRVELIENLWDNASVWGVQSESLTSIGAEGGKMVKNEVVLLQTSPWVDAPWNS